jgi:hypothetical protein
VITVNAEKKTLRILMTGLCAFVPRDDIEKNPKDNQMRVLLVESSTGMDMSSMAMGYTHEPHVPVLVARHVNVNHADAYRRPDLTYTDWFGEAWDVFCLDGQDLRIKAAQPHRLEIDVFDGAGVGYPTDENQTSFQWVANLAKISPGSEKVDDSCLKTPPDPAIVARLALTEGRVFSYLLASDGGRSTVLWKYKIPNVAKRGPSHRQAAANVVGFESHFAESVEILAKPFAKNLNTRMDRLFERISEPPPIGLKPENGEKGLEIWVKNMPWADILGTRKPEGFKFKPDVHFAHLYKVSENYEDVNVPHFCEERYPSDLHQGNPNCQPVRTDPNDMA